MGRIAVAICFSLSLSNASFAGPKVDNQAHTMTMTWLQAKLRSKVKFWSWIDVQDLTFEEISFRYALPDSRLSVQETVAELNRQASQGAGVTMHQSRGPEALPGTGSDELAIESNGVSQPNLGPAEGRKFHKLQEVKAKEILKNVWEGNAAAKSGAWWMFLERSRLLVSASRGSPFLQRTVPAGFVYEGRFCKVVSAAFEASTSPQGNKALAGCLHKVGLQTNVKHLPDIVLKGRLEKTAKLYEFIGLLLERHRLSITLAMTLKRYPETGDTDVFNMRAIGTQLPASQLDDQPGD